VRCILPFLAILSLVGCGTRSEERTDYKWSGSITVPVPTAEGKIVPTPVPFKLVGQANAEKVEKTGVDTDAIAEVVRTTIMAAMASSGPSWMTMLGAGGTLLTGATTAYLALAKRDQMKKMKG
jgi:hypothetical protein